MKYWLVGIAGCAVAGCSDPVSQDPRPGRADGTGGPVESSDVSSSGGRCDVEYEDGISIGLRLCETEACTSAMPWPDPNSPDELTCIVDRPCELDGVPAWCLRECVGDDIAPADVLAFVWSPGETLQLPVAPGDSIALSNVRVQFPWMWVARDLDGGLLGFGGSTPRPPPPEATAPLSLAPGDPWCTFASFTDDPAHAGPLDASVDGASVSVDWGQTRDVGTYRVWVDHAIDIPWVSAGYWSEGGAFGYAAVRR